MPLAKKGCLCSIPNITSLQTSKIFTNSGSFYPALDEKWRSRRVKNVPMLTLFQPKMLGCFTLASNINHLLGLSLFENDKYVFHFFIWAVDKITGTEWDLQKSKVKFETIHNIENEKVECIALWDMCCCGFACTFLQLLWSMQRKRSHSLKSI